MPGEFQIRFRKVLERRELRRPSSERENTSGVTLSQGSVEGNHVGWDCVREQEVPYAQS